MIQISLRLIYRRLFSHDADLLVFCNYIEDIQVLDMNMTFVSSSEVKYIYISWVAKLVKISLFLN